MSETLTNRQKEILTFVRDFQREHNRPPAVREIGEGVGLSSPCTVYRHLETLEKRGYITRQPGKARSIEIINADYSPSEIKRVPIIGRIAAGVPLFAEQNLEGFVPVCRDEIGEGEYFALKVKGQSMIEAGIMNGDTVVCRRQETANDGQIIVAFVPNLDNGSATLKSFHPEGDRVRLQPANSKMEPIYVDAKEGLQVMGIVEMVIRKL